MEMDILAEGSKQRKDIDDLRGVRRELRLIDRGSQLWRRSQIQRQGYILRQIEGIVRQRVSADIAAQRISAIACSGRGRQLLIDLFPDLQTNRTGVGKICVVTANIEGDRKIEQRL